MWLASRVHDYLRGTGACHWICEKEIVLLIERLKIVEQEKICKVPLFSLFYEFALLQILFFRKEEKGSEYNVTQGCVANFGPFSNWYSQPRRPNLSFSFLNLAIKDWSDRVHRVVSAFTWYTRYRLHLFCFSHGMAWTRFFIFLSVPNWRLLLSHLVIFKAIQLVLGK